MAKEGTENKNEAPGSKLTPFLFLFSLFFSAFDVGCHLDPKGRAPIFAVEKTIFFRLNL